MSSPVLRRAVRREMHSPRTVATVIVLLLVMAGAVLAGIEIVLHLAGVGPLLITPGAALGWVSTALTALPQPTVVAVGGVVVVVGVVIVALGVTPGRRPRHVLDGSPHAVLVDNGVIASSVAERVRRELDLAHGAVIVGVGHRSADVAVRPEPGQIVDRSALREIAERELAGYRLTPRVRVRTRIVRVSHGVEAS